jgi:hypothetical protein
VKEALQQVENNGFVKKCQGLSWHTPTVVFTKMVKCCGDFSATVNPYLNLEYYPLALLGEKYYCVLDLAQAYQQLQAGKELQYFIWVLYILFGCYAFVTDSSVFQSTITHILGDWVACLFTQMIF